MSSIPMRSSSSPSAFRSFARYQYISHDLSIPIDHLTRCLTRATNGIMSTGVTQRFDPLILQPQQIQRSYNLPRFSTQHSTNSYFIPSQCKAQGLVRPDVSFRQSSLEALRTMITVRSDYADTRTPSLYTDTELIHGREVIHRSEKESSEGYIERALLLQHQRISGTSQRISRNLLSH